MEMTHFVSSGTQLRVDVMLFGVGVFLPLLGSRALTVSADTSR